MRLLHIADLHLGKSIGNYSLIEDQAYGLKQILDIVDSENIDVIMIAGDIFDTTIASVDALKLYSDFIDELIFKKKKIVLAISGNHDSQKRLDIHTSFFRENNYYLSGEYGEDIVTLSDEYGEVHFHMIPFISINQARGAIDSAIEDYTDLYRMLLKDKTYEDRNVLITHCYANDQGIEDMDIYNEGQKRLIVGGSDAMDGHLFMDFDYVALGHIHGGHKVIDEKIRYSGTFMKYSFDEVLSNKSVTLVNLTDTIDIKQIPIYPLRDLKVMEGKFEEILMSEPSDDYIKFILHDDHTVENAMSKLKNKFPHAVQITYKNREIFSNTNELNVDVENKDTLDLFKEFYKFKMDEEMTENELAIIKDVLS